MLNGAAYTYVSGARIIATVLPAKNVRYSASASSTTCPRRGHQNDIQERPLGASTTYVRVCRRKQRDQDVDEDKGGGNIPEIKKRQGGRT